MIGAAYASSNDRAIGQGPEPNNAWPLPQTLATVVT